MRQTSFGEELRAVVPNSLDLCMNAQIDLKIMTSPSKEKAKFKNLSKMILRFFLVARSLAGSEPQIV